MYVRQISRMLIPFYTLISMIESVRCSCGGCGRDASGTAVYAFNQNCSESIWLYRNRFVATSINRSEYNHKHKHANYVHTTQNTHMTCAREVSRTTLLYHFVCSARHTLYTCNMFTLLLGYNQLGVHLHWLRCVCVWDWRYRIDQMQDNNKFNFLILNAFERNIFEYI